MHSLAVLDRQTGRLEEAQAGYEQALALARQLGDPAAEADGLGSLGLLTGQLGKPEQGRKLVLEALAIRERLGDISWIGITHQYLAWLDEQEGNRAGAIEHYRETLRCFEQVQSPDAEEVRAGLRKLGERI